MARVGFIGVGNMGAPMARNLIKAGHSLKVFDLNEEAVNFVVQSGAKRASSIKDAAKGVDFVDYFKAGSSILVAKGNPNNIKTLDDLCGHTVAVQQGTVQDTDILTPQIGKCKTAGKDLTVLKFEKDTDALQQVKNGRAVANVEDFPVASYNAQTSGGGNDFQVAGSQVGAVGTYGIAVPKSNTQLRDALQAALKAIIANGTYNQILQKWDVTAGADTSASINAGS